MKPSRANHDYNSWYGWVVVLGCMYIQAVIVGGLVGSSMFFVLFSEYFKKGVGRTFAVQSLQALVGTLAGPFAGGLSKRFGCRPLVVSAGIIAVVAIILTSFATSLEWVYITYGLILGTALTFMYIPSIVIVGQYFTKRHALANGMVFTGAGIGMMALPPLYQILIETYGWRSALIVISGIYMNAIVSGMLMKPPILKGSFGNHVKLEPEDSTEMCRETNNDDIIHSVVAIEQNNVDKLKQELAKPQKTRILQETLNIRLLRRNAWLKVICAVGLFLGFAYMIGLIHFVPNAVSENIEKLDATFLMSIMGITSIVGRSLHGWFVDLGYFCPATVLAVSLSGAGLCLVGMPLSNGSYAILATVAAGFGFCMGVAMPLSSVTLKVCVGIEHLPNALGWFALFNGLGNMMGAPFAGWLYDMTSNYNVSFIMASSSMIIAGCILFTKLACQKWKSKNTSERETEYKDIPVSESQCMDNDYS